MSVVSQKYKLNFMINFEQYTIEELQELRNNLNNYIYNYDDGYLYICKVRSYGRNWIEHVTNKISLQELCDRYDGYDGIVDVYSTNPSLQDIQNYGDVKFIYSKEQYEKWDSYQYLLNMIPNLEEDLENWENTKNDLFRNRPLFGPIYKEEDIESMKRQAEELFKEGIVPPSDYP